MATAPLIFDLQTPGEDLARKTVFVKLRLGLPGNSRKVSSSQVEVGADKDSIRVSKQLLDSPDLEAVRRLDGDLRRYLYSMCLPFEPGIHLLPIPLIETVDAKLREFQTRRQELVEVFLAAYPRLCEEAALRLRTLYNPLDYPPLDAVGAEFTASWQYISYGVPDQLRAVSERMFQEERDKAADRMAEAYTEVRQVLREAMVELVAHLRDRLTDQPDGMPQRVRETTVQKLREFLDTFDFPNVTNDQEVKDQVERARSLLAGTTMDAIRNTAELRARGWRTLPDDSKPWFQIAWDASSALGKPEARREATMGDRSKIEWMDATWNPIVAFNRQTGKRGWFCTHVSDGCRFCYAERITACVAQG